jgi:eukaryotic-like serine/threonine-protein kinase
MDLQPRGGDVSAQQALNLLPEEQRHFGRYTLLCHLATGGMANLYLARFTGSEGFEKLVAIKRIHDHLTEQVEFIQMFVDEARLASRISHPNVVQVLELGSVGSSHFIAMEYIDGETLTALVRRCQLPLRLCARIIANASAGLHAAHELRAKDGEMLNVVHRDVSPHNILISYDGDVKVVDFGVARAKSNLHTTNTGTVKGKFAYMAPEQARLAEVDRRADVFALGIVLYEITTRHRLFRADTEAATIAKVLAAEILPPSRIVNDFPQRLESIIMRSLQRDPNRRYPSAEQMQEALESYIIESGPPLMQSAIGQLCRNVFADRITQKRDLLRACEQVSDVLPEAELPSNPTLTMGGATVSHVRQLQEQRTRRRRLVALAVAGVFFGAALVVLGMVFLRPTPSVTWVEGAGTGTGSGSAVTAPARPSRKITIWIRVTPVNATITLGGKLVGNPYEGQREAVEGTVLAVASADGFVTQQFKIPLGEGGRWVIGLERKAEPIEPAEKKSDPRPKIKKKQPVKKRTSGDDDDLFDPYGKK